ncbi:MAG: hypothetical protein J0M08_06390 [Bacteroidetes bacterium]|nr:hypothetical protein [Bacteroidota bacterium]
MKTILKLTTATVLSAVTLLNAQVDTLGSNSQRTEALKLSLGANFGVAYEKKIGKATSLQFSLEHLTKQWDMDALDLGIGGSSSRIGGDVNGINVGLDYRRYLSEPHNNLNGFYTAPFVRYKQYNFENSILETPKTQTHKQVDVGAMIGYQILGEDGFLIDFGFGVKYKADIGGPNPLSDRVFNNFGTYTHLRIAYNLKYKTVVNTAVSAGKWVSKNEFNQKNLVKINPFFYFNKQEVAYERFITDNISAQISIGAVNHFSLLGAKTVIDSEEVSDEIGKENDSLEYTGLKKAVFARLSCRIYLNKIKYLHSKSDVGGMYITPIYTISKQKTIFEDVSERNYGEFNFAQHSVNHLMGVAVGYQTGFGRLMVDGSIGYHGLVSTKKSERNYANADASNTAFAAKFGSVDGNSTLRENILEGVKIQLGVGYRF